MHHLLTPTADTWQEALGIFMVITFVVMSIVWSAWILFKLISSRSQRKSPSLISKKEICVLLLAGAVLLCVFYGYCIEPYQLTIDTVELKSNKVHQPIRIVHISDLHCDGTIRTEKKLPRVIQSLKPDLIVFTGDAANNKSGSIHFRNCMHDIGLLAPTFAVYGNHDSRVGKNWNLYGTTGVNLLNCDSQIVTIKDTKIWIAGVAVDNEKCLEQTLDQAPAQVYTIFLYHYPSGIKSASLHAIDLFCTGHTHGGQVRLPFYGAIVTESSAGKKYEWGQYKVGNTSMYVSRGIGMITIPIRFLSPPEVTAIDISPGAQ